MAIYEVVYCKKTKQTEHFRTQIPAESEFYARRKLIDKLKNDCIILSCINYSEPKPNKATSDFINFFNNTINKAK